MKKLLIVVLIALPVLLLAGCGMSPEEKAAKNVFGEAGEFMKNVIEIGEAQDKGEISDEEAAKMMMGEYTDMIIDSTDGTEDELSDEEKDALKDIMTNPEKLGEMMEEEYNNSKEE